MNASRQDESPGHDSIVERLPWYANGALPGAECAEIEVHLLGCEDCRQQLEKERRLVELFRESPMPERSPEPGLAQLLARIANEDSARPAAAPFAGLRRRLERIAAWFGEAVPMRPLAGAGAFALALGVSLMAWQGSVPDPAGPASFRVLGESGTAAASEPHDIHLVFAPSASEARQQELLDAVGGRMVGGPNSAGAITVRIEAAGGSEELATALARLRREPEVLLAEAVMPKAMPHIGPGPTP